MKEQNERQCLINNLQDKLVPCGVEPRILDIRQLKSAEKVLNTILAMKEEKEDLNKRSAAIKFTKNEIAERSGLNRATLGRTDHLDKIIEYYSPMEEDEKEATIKLQKTVIDDLKRKEQEWYGKEIEMEDLKNEIDNLEKELELARKQAEATEEKNNELNRQLSEMRRQQVNLVATKQTEVS